VGQDTFGYDRYLNQILYQSSLWKSVRDEVIIRDSGCDLGIPGYDITDKIIVHHINPITEEQIEHVDDIMFDPDFLICTSHKTHMAIHYGDERLLPKPMVVRRPGDTVPWR
jgi:5-methylcytosine-specific restriction endonuclease McrA